MNSNLKTAHNTIFTLESKIDFLEKEKEDLRSKASELELMKPKFTNCNHKYDEVLKLEKSRNDRRGYGYSPEITHNINNPKQPSVKSTQHAPKKARHLHSQNPKRKTIYCYLCGFKCHKHMSVGLRKQGFLLV